MKDTSRIQWLSRAIDVALFFAMVLGICMARNEVMTTGWTSIAWQLLLLVIVLLAAVALTFLRAMLERNSFERLFSQNRHLIGVHDNGKVVLSGHRITLYQIMKDLRKLHGSEDVATQLRELHPTLDDDFAKKIVNFCEQNPRQLRGFFRQQRRSEERSARGIERCRAGFSLEDLRRQRDERLNSA